MTFNRRRRRRAAVHRPTAATIAEALAKPPQLGDGTHIYDAVAQARRAARQDAQHRAGSIVRALGRRGHRQHGRASRRASPAARAAARPDLHRRAALGTRSTRARCSSSPAAPTASYSEADDPSRPRADLRRARHAARERVPAPLPLARQPGPPQSRVDGRGRRRPRAGHAATTRRRRSPTAADAAGPTPAASGTRRSAWSLVASLCALLIGLAVVALLCTRVHAAATVADRLQGFVSAAARGADDRVSGDAHRSHAAARPSARWRRRAGGRAFKEELEIARIEMPADPGRRAHGARARSS